MKFIEELKAAILEEDFYKTNEILEEVKREENAFEYLKPLFTIMEENPYLDFGVPGPVVHFMETYYKRGYEQLLLESVQRTPTSQTVWMLNRIINDSQLENREQYLAVLAALLERTDISESIRADVEEFYKYQCNQ